MARSRNSVDDALRAALSGLSLSPARPVAIAFSGGLDSSVLLHAVVRQVGAASVVALHVNHGLQPAAGSWAAQCADQAARLAVRFDCLYVPGPVPRGANVEGWAREQRYRLLYAACRDAQAQALLTAHHADDQLETLLLALARGSGLDGLCGMAPRDVREQVLLLRPLLDLPRGVLRHEAQQTGLQWIEDPSHADVRLRRNALRHQVLPALSQTLPDPLPRGAGGLLVRLATRWRALAEARVQGGQGMLEGPEGRGRRTLGTLGAARGHQALGQGCGDLRVSQFAVERL